MNTELQAQAQLDQLRKDTYTYMEATGDTLAWTIGEYGAYDICCQIDTEEMYIRYGIATDEGKFITESYNEAVRVLSDVLDDIASAQRDFVEVALNAIGA